MLTPEGARLQVLLDLQREHGRRGGLDELVIIDQQTLERPWGWVFFYTTRGWLNGDWNYAICGNAPYMVNRYDGSIQFAGTAHPIEHYIHTYENALERKAGAWELLIHEPGDCSLKLLGGIRKALQLSIDDTAKLKQRLPCVWARGAFVDLEPLRQRLQEANVSVELRHTKRCVSNIT